MSESLAYLGRGDWASNVCSAWNWKQKVNKLVREASAAHNKGGGGRGNKEKNEKTDG
jgi:hypothetical protein